MSTVQGSWLTWARQTAAGWGRR